MASEAFESWLAHATSRPAPPESTTLAQRRAGIDAVMGGLPLAEGTESETRTLGAVEVISCRRRGREDGRRLVYFHGGGYRLGSALAYRSFGSHLADACAAHVLVVDYRLAPESPFPAAAHDGLAVYRALLESGASPDQVVVGGDSAGGGLAVAVMLAARAEGLPVPGGAVCLSPWVDLANTAESYRERGPADVFFSKSAADEAARLYLAGADPRDPLASPVHGDFAGLPPLLIQVGENEVLLDDAAQLAAVAQAAGVDARHRVFPEMVHTWQLNHPAFPEAVEAVDEIAAFVGAVTS